MKSATLCVRRAAAIGAAFSVYASAVFAQTPTPLKIGVLSDMSGIVADLSGRGSVLAARMAIEDANGSVLGRPIQLLEADHLNKADTGLTIARQWYDSDVRAIFDVGITTVAVGVQDLAREKNRIVIFNSTGSADITGKYCSPNGIQWTYSNYAMALGAIKGQIDAGAKTWYFITVDYTFGKIVQRDATGIIERAGGKVVGSTTHPISSTDFASQFLQAQASKADVIALASLGSHSAAMLKQAEEFGIRAKGQRIAPIGLTLLDIKAIGLPATQGLFLAEPYYWDQTDATRAFAKRYKDRFGKMPNMMHASVYGAVSHYLKAVAAAGTDDTAAVLAKMRATPINDFMTKDGSILEDGRVLRESYGFKVKKPSESKDEWDLYAPVSTIGAAQLFAPGKSECPLIK